MSKCFFWVFYVFDFKWHFLANSWHALCVFATNLHLLSSWEANRVKHGERQATALAFLFCSFLLAESVNPCFHCASFVNTPKLSTRMRLPRLALFQRIKANVFARWDQEVFPHVVLSRTSSWGFQKQVVVFLIFSFKWNSGSMKPPVVDAHLRSLVFFAQWSVHKTTPKKWEKVCFPCLHAGRKTQHMAYACFSSKENQLPVSCWTSEFTSSTKTKTQWFFDCFLVRRSKYPHVFCLEIDWSKQHWPSMMSANPNIYWTQVSCNWTKHFAGNLSPGNVGLSGNINP